MKYVGFMAMIGAMAFTNGCALFGAADKEISMNELPVAVRPLAEKEVGKGKIIEVEKDMKGGKVIYAITYDRSGTPMELEYLADGTLLFKGKE